MGMCAARVKGTRARVGTGIAGAKCASMSIAGVKGVGMWLSIIAGRVPQQLGPEAFLQ